MNKNEIELTNSLPHIALTKADIDSLSSAITENVMNGNINPVELAVNFKSFAKVIDNVLKATEKAQIAEVEHNGGKYNAYGATISLKEGGKRYDYSGCGHRYYDKIVEQIENLTETRKEFEREMLTHKESWIYTNKFTGESYEVAPPESTSKTVVEVRLNS